MRDRGARLGARLGHLNLPPAPPVHSVEMASDPHVLDPDHQPTPFSAEEIRLGCPAGRTVRMRVEQPGQPTVIRTTTFVTVDAEGADQEVREETLDGEPVGDVVRRRSTWLGFQGHASMPKAETTIHDETIEIPAGRFDCLVYTRTDGPEVSTFWFARSAPGLPLRFESRVDGEPVYAAVALSNEMPS